jgi:dipeptidyl aminopeptidase/acylaminoacyl peptidase
MNYDRILVARDVATDTSSFRSGGQQIGVESFIPAKAVQCPGILVLHGAGGMDSGNKYVRQLAGAVAGNGYATFLVEYFERTGTTYASDPIIHVNFDKWVDTIQDATTFIADHHSVDRDRIGTVGYSVGGYLAVAHTAGDARIRAVVEVAGGIDPELARMVKRLPPTLIIHGKEDQRVSFARAMELEALLKKLGTPVKTEFYPNERHILSPAAAIAALGSALEFLGEQMH